MEDLLITVIVALACPLCIPLVLNDTDIKENENEK